MNKKAQLGFGIRLIAAIIIAVSLPFLVLNPVNIYAQISFGFGNFLMLLGGLIE